MSEVNKEFTFENEQYRKTYWHAGDRKSVV